MGDTRTFQMGLVGLRFSVFLVMLMWTLDKFIRPEHAAKVYENFYFIPGITASISTTLGILELILLMGFLLGLAKKLTYGGVFILHAISTLSSIPQYINPYEGGNLLFFAAWPMLAACWMLYLMRDKDHIFTLGKP